MELQAKARHLPFMTASARLYDRFHISMDDDTFIERAYWIWRSIGNIALELKSVAITVSSDLVVTLPQDCEFVRSLTTTDFADDRNFGGSFGDYSFSPKGRAPEVKPDPTTVSIEANIRSSQATTAGERVSYKTYPGYLKVESPMMATKSVWLVYSSIVTDTDGLPLLNDPEVEAIVYTMALREAESALFRKEVGADKLVTYLSPLSERALCDAKAPEKISDDALDALLDIKTSWGRKIHNSKFNFNTGG
jgi:hypothetical protein